MSTAPVALVTGAGRGIGAATVATLAAEGWAVVAVDRCADDPRLPYGLATRRDLDAVVASAGSAIAVVADVCDEGALAHAVDVAERQLGGLDAVVAAAGVVAGGVPLWEMEHEQVDALLDANLRGVIAAVRCGIPALLRRPEPRRGRFVAVSSTAATRGLPMLAAYCATKAAVSGLVRAVAVELGASGVTANVVAPGATETAILEESMRLYDLESVDAFARQQPIGRLIDPAEIAAAIAWLLRPGAGAVTGATVPVDGGLAL